MAANKVIIFPTIALTATIANLYSPGTHAGSIPATVVTFSPSIYFIFRHIRIVNTTTTAIFAALWKQITIGASPATGKELIWGATATGLALDANRGVSVAGASFVEWFGMLRVDNLETDKFIVGGASAVGLTIQGEGEIGVN